MNKPFARRLALAVTACFTWSLVLATSARAITARPPAPPSRCRPLSASEMQHIVGAQTDDGSSAPVTPAPYPPNPDFGGSKGSGTNSLSPVGGDPGGGTNESDAGAAPGPSYPWEGTVGDVKTDTGNKMTEIPLVGWT